MMTMECCGIEGCGSSRRWLLFLGRGLEAHYPRQSLVDVGEDVMKVQWLLSSFPFGVGMLDCRKIEGRSDG